MAIDSYATLQTAIENWPARPSDALIQARATEFIDLFESSFRRRLRTKDMETRTSFTLTTSTDIADGGRVSVASNFGGVRGHLRIVSTVPLFTLEFITPVQMDRSWASSLQGRPRVYTIEALQFRIRPLADVSYTIEYLYYLKLPVLSGANTTNWLLDDHPDIYLFGSLFEMHTWADNKETAAFFKARLEVALEELKVEDQRDRWSGGPLTIRSDVAVATR